MRGDGAQMGWVVIEKVSERSSHIDSQGIGRVIDIDVSVRRAAKPSNGSFFSAFSGMFS
jgi:phage protein U